MTEPKIEEKTEGEDVDDKVVKLNVDVIGPDDELDIVKVQ
jgi:hypothetical protein